MLIIEGLIETFIEPFNFSFFSITGWVIGLDNHDIEWFALETNRDLSVIFEIAPKYCILVEEEMATHSCILVWRIPWTEEPGGLQSRGSQRVRHD